MGFEKVYNNYAREASLLDGAMFLKDLESKSARRKKKAGELGGGAQPPICKHDILITRSQVVHIWLLVLLAR